MFFWRLFLTNVIFVIAAVALTGLLTIRRMHDSEAIQQLVPEVLSAVVVVILASIIPAYLMARSFSRPFQELIEGAKRLAEGDLSTTIEASSGREFATLARSLNDMSTRLEGTFAQLAQDREQLRTILSGMIEGVVAIDNDQHILFANERAGVLLEFDPNVAVGRKLWEVSRQRAIQEIVDKALVGDGPYREELDWTGQDVKTLRVYISRLPGPHSPGAVMVLHDITELRRLERLRQDFVANVSHELKTPLAVIRSNIEALEDGAADDPQMRTLFLGRVTHETSRLHELIQDLLHLARIESGDQPFDLGPVPIAEIIHECLERQGTRAEGKRQTLQAEPPPTPAVAWVDSDAIGHVVDNLVDNAIKYTPVGGQIIVRWGCSMDHVFIEVQDSGIGISERDLPRIFERFYRADKARSRAVGGTGLGLAIVKHLVQAMDGTVTASSRLGQGTTFRVLLPRAKDTAIK